MIRAYSHAVDRRSFIRTGAVASAASLVSGVGSSLLSTKETHDEDAAALASSVAQHPARGHARVWWSGEAGDRGRLALTFDDGPTEQFTARLLDLLRDRRIPATFFVIGELVERHPDLVRRARDEGHELGNHSFDHVSAVRLDAAGVHDGMARGAQVIEQTIGVRPRWYRPPRGEVTSATLLSAQDLHQDVALWSVVRDGPDGGAADDDRHGVLRHLSAAAHPGAVVDLHDGIGRSAWDGLPSKTLLARRAAELAVLPDVLTAWAAQGYEFTTLSDLIPA